MKKSMKRILTGTLAAAIVVGLGSVSPVFAATVVDPVPPDYMLSSTQIERHLTVPNGINVNLTDEHGTPLEDGAFSLLNEQNTPVLSWTGNSGYHSCDDFCTFDKSMFYIPVPDLYDIGDYTGGVVFSSGDGFPYDNYQYLEYEDMIRYIGYGDRMSNVNTITIPAGEVWINVPQGYKRAADQTRATQSIAVDTSKFDLSDLAGTTKKVPLSPGKYDCQGTYTYRFGGMGGSFGSVISYDKSTEYVPITIDLHELCAKWVDADGTYTKDGTTYHYGAPHITDSLSASTAFMSIYSGSITNLIALDGSPTATIYVQKGDYYPYCSVMLCSWKGDTASRPDGQGANRIDLLRFAKHTLHLIAPPTTGVNVGYLPAGTYTLHQDRVPDGYIAAPDQKITIKDSAQFSDFQKITVVNQKQPVEHQHTYSDKWSWDDNNHWHAATCEHTDLVSDKGAHTLTDWVVIQQPTTESNGIKECHCTVCKYTLTQVIDKLPTIIPGLPLGPSQTIIPGLPLGPSQTIIPGLPLGPSQTIIPGLPLGPSQTIIPGLPLGPSQTIIPGLPLGPSQTIIPGLPLEPSQSTIPVTPAEPETVAPPTGDTSPMAFWAAVAALSCAGLAGVGIVYKKKQHQV